jgi:CubicO group peptidase (beta-lactamase class C family)
MSTNRRIFLKQIGLGAAGLSLLSSQTYSLDRTSKSFSLPRSKPEQQGVSSAGIIEFLDAVEKSKVGFHSIMIVRHGKVVAEGWWTPYAPELKHTLYSLSKSFTSTAVGLAVKEGRLKIEDKVISFFPNELPDQVSENLAAMTVKDLLTMSTGHASDTLPPMRNATGTTWTKTFLEQPVEFKPGTHFLYNTGATFMLSVIVQKLTGEPLIEYLKPRLFDPLGITGMDWVSNHQGINVGGYGLRVKTEDIAKFGLLYLQKGVWDGKQILPAKWVEDATSKQVNSNPSGPNYNADSDWAQGYGYQFWRCTPGGYRADGAFGQFSMVLPEYDAVIAITSESFNMQESMKLVWTHLLPAMKPTAITSDGLMQKQAAEKLKALTLPLPKEHTGSSLAKSLSDKKYSIDSNEYNVKTVSFAFEKDHCLLTVTNDKGEHRISCGMNKWNSEKGERTPVFQTPGRTDISTSVASSATWQDDNTLLITQRYTENAHGDQLTCMFEDSQLTIKLLSSITMGNPNATENRADLKGHFNA